jgi:uncharacterized protein YcfJ
MMRCRLPGAKPEVSFRSKIMLKKFLLASAVLATLAPAAAFAQSGGAAAGAATGAVGGAIVGGPVGAAVGGVTGAIVGGIADQQQPEFRQYVTTQKVPSYTYREEVRVGAVLPEAGVTYYEVPAEYKVKGYRYTVVNNTPVLVEPSSRKIVQVIR